MGILDKLLIKINNYINRLDIVILLINIKKLKN